MGVNFTPERAYARACENDDCVILEVNGNRIAACEDAQQLPGSTEGFDCNSEGDSCELTICQ